MDNIRTDIYLISNDPTKFKPFCIDRRIQYQKKQYDTSNTYFRLNLENRNVVNHEFSFSFYELIFDYYEITNKIIFAKLGFHSENTSLFLDGLSPNSKKYFIEPHYMNFFRNYLPEIIKKSNKPQIIYFEEDFFKIPIILDNQIIKKYMRKSRGIFGRIKFDYSYSILSNDIFIFFDNIYKRKKTNFDNIKLIYE